MSEETPERAEVQSEPEPKVPRDLSYWEQYLDRPAFIQFRQGLVYVLVTYPHQPVPTTLTDKESGEQIKVPMVEEAVSGILREVGVDPDGSARLIIERPDPDRNKLARQRIVIHTGDVAFATFTEAQLIQT